ncbi:hypothetical protein H0H81_008085, partial [Sphagnurus paluster]
RGSSLINALAEEQTPDMPMCTKLIIDNVMGHCAISQFTDQVQASTKQRTQLLKGKSKQGQKRALSPDIGNALNKSKMKKPAT